MFKKAIVFCLFLLFIVGSFHSKGQVKQTVSGRIIDYDTRQPLKNVSVIIRQTKVGTITNDSGYFSLPAARNNFTVVISLVGYSNASREFDLLGGNTIIVVDLKKKANEQMDEVVLNALRENAKVKSVEMNVVKINPDLIKRAPVLFGEADIIKALILQPGVTNTGEGAGGFNVRGGNTDQNLVLVDGAPLFNTSHLLGFYTAVSPDAVQDVTLYKGGMPAPYGGRLSSLLNMKIKNGTNTTMHYTGGIGPMSTRFFMNGPLIKNKLTFTAGFRAAYPDLILNQLRDKFGASRAFFYDGLAKAEYSFSPANKLSITAYRSYDRFRFDTSTAYNWESNLVTLNYSADFNTKYSFRLNANVSNFVSTIHGLDKYYDFDLKSSITQKQVKPMLIIRPGDKHIIEAGVDFISYHVSPGSRVPVSDSSNINPILIEKEQGREIAAFISEQFNFTDKISLQVGLRYAHYSFLGPKNIFRYEEGVPNSKETITDTIAYGKNKSIQNYSGLEPRIALKIGITDELSFKLSYNRGQQFLHLISNTTAISPVDFWKLSDPNIKRQTGSQYAAGVFKSFRENLYEASVEIYYRTTQNTVQYKDGGLLFLNPYIESALLNASGRAFGIEWSFAKNIGKFTGQVNYTFSGSQVKVNSGFPAEQVNGGKYYASDMDRPHNLSVMAKIKLGYGWSFSSNFVYTSGRPATYPDGNYIYNGTVVTNYSLRNMDRLPAYHRLDAGFTYISKRYAEQKKYSIWNISFYNIYMRQNAYSIYFKREGTQLLPYRLSVVGGLIPSVTWNYNF